MRLLFPVFSLAASMLIASDADAASIATTNSSPILAGSFITYTGFGNGDVVFRQVNNSVAQCFGYWLRPSDPGFSHALSTVLTALATQTAIQVSVDTTQIWNGSGAPFCLVYNIVM